jgi:anti-sigma factor RsiW
MKCDGYAHELGDYVDGTLADAPRARLETHLGTCPRCRALVSDFEAIRSLASSLEPHAPPARVWQRLSAATTPPRRPWLLRADPSSDGSQPRPPP